MKKGIPLILIILTLASCQKKPEIRIAEQFGLAYAPLQIMRSKQFLEKRQPGLSVEWVKMGNTAAIREAVLSGDLDAGFMGIPPFLIARDKEMPWKIAIGISRAPLALMVAPGKYKNLSDFTSKEKIALPQPGSIQHILLTMAAEKESGNASLLDNNLVSLKHPDGMNALVSGSVQGHFTSPPYLFQEKDAGFEALVSGEEAMGGPFTFIVGTVTERFRKKQPEIYSDFIASLEDAIRFINEEPDETLAILSREYKQDESVLEKWLYFSEMEFDKEILGVDQFISFMYEQGYLENRLTEDEVIFEN